ncbi:MAG: hypothetical protein AAGA99_04965 [Actinomycetota bacterium]
MVVYVQRTNETPAIGPAVAPASDRRSARDEPTPRRRRRDADDPPPGRPPSARTGYGATVDPDDGEDQVSVLL